MNPFSNYKESYFIKDRVKNKRIIVGEYSYYAGFYHGEDFENRVRYLDRSDEDREGDNLIIGKFCSIASGVVFLMGGNQGHRLDWLTAYPLEIFEDDFDNYQTKSPPGFQDRGDTIVGNDVWIGTEAAIMPGITIGDGSIIAARTVVTKDVEPYAIVGGNPLKMIRKRFSEEEIDTLEDIQWWNWDMEKIKEHLDVLRSGDVKKLKEVIDG